MKKYINPLWTHIPAVGALLTLIIYLAAAGPLPASAPVHFGVGGQPDSYGSPWMTFGLTIGLSLFFILLSAFSLGRNQALSVEYMVKSNKTFDIGYRQSYFLIADNLFQLINRF